MAASGNARRSRTTIAIVKVLINYTNNSETYGDYGRCTR